MSTWEVFVRSFVAFYGVELAIVALAAIGLVIAGALREYLIRREVRRVANQLRGIVARVENEEARASRN